MYIYRSGMIGEAVRTKLDSTRSAVMSGTKSDTGNFSDLLRSLYAASAEYYPERKRRKANEG